MQEAERLIDRQYSASAVLNKPFRIFPPSNGPEFHVLVYVEPNHAYSTSS